MIRRRRPRKKFHINKRDLRPGNIIFTCVNTLIMLCVIVVMLYPFWNTVAVSFNDAQDTLRGGIKLFPRAFSMYSYQISTVLGVIIGSMIAYVLSRKELVAKKFITSYFLVTMYISAGLIPNYFLMKDLKMINSFAVYVVPGLVSVYNIIVIRSFIQGLPESLTEAAMVDGAGHFRCYWQIVLPCCKPVLATVALWCAVGAWNQWFDTFLYCSSKENLTTLQYEMMKLLSSATQSGRDLSSVYGNGQQVANTITPTSIRAAVTIVASAPILVVYPFLQNYFVKGVTLGATKG